MVKDSQAAKDCTEWRNRLLGEFENYSAAVEAFNKEVECSGLKAQLERDQTAMRRQMKSIEDGNAELNGWNEKRAEAEKQALKHATNFLVDTLVAAADEFSDKKLNAIESEFKKRAPEGEIWQRKLEKVRGLRERKARWSAINDGIKSAEIAGPAGEAWLDLQSKAMKAEREAESVDAILKEIGRDAEGKQILEENGLRTVSEYLKTKLAPWLSNSFSLGDFLITYGLDATEWKTAGDRIKQQIALRDGDLAAVASLKKQIERAVKKLAEANCTE